MLFGVLVAAAGKTASPATIVFSTEIKERYA